MLAGLPYVPEVAALEWFRQEAYHAPDAPRLALARLQAVPPRAQETLRLGLHPAVRLMRSSYPVVTIWTTNQRDDEPETVALDGGENALIWRGPDGIHVRRIGEAMQRLLRVLEAGEPFADACETALSAEPAFDPGRALAWICENGVLSTASWT